MIDDWHVTKLFEAAASLELAAELAGELGAIELASSLHIDACGDPVPGFSARCAECRNIRSVVEWVDYVPEGDTKRRHCLYESTLKTDSV